METSHGKEWGAPIVSLDRLAECRETLGKIVVTSGGFDPIHPGHISCIIESKKFGDTLVVIVNGDAFLTHKKGRPFQDLETRSLIVSGVKEVDYVVPFEIEDDMSVSKALEAIRPQVFTKGGDRADKKDLREWEICKKYGIEVVFGVGEEKKWSSSWFLKDWGQAKN